MFRCKNWINIRIELNGNESNGIESNGNEWKNKDLEDALFNISGSLGEGSSSGGRFITARFENESAPSVIESLVAIGCRIDPGRSAAAGVASSATATQRRHRRADVVLGPEARRHSERSAGPHSVTVSQSSQPLSLVRSCNIPDNYNFNSN